MHFSQGGDVHRRGRNIRENRVRRCPCGRAPTLAVTGRGNKAHRMAPAEPSLNALVASIRRNCPSGLWSKGVSLARDGGVTVESRSAQEIVLRVRSPGRVVAPTAVL